MNWLLSLFRFTHAGRDGIQPLDPLEEKHLKTLRRRREKEQRRDD